MSYVPLGPNNNSSATRQAHATLPPVDLTRCQSPGRRLLDAIDALLQRQAREKALLQPAQSISQDPQKAMREHLSHNVVLNLDYRCLLWLSRQYLDGDDRRGIHLRRVALKQAVGHRDRAHRTGSASPALPAGWAADRYGRAKVCRAGSLAILVAAPAYAYETLRATEGRDKELSYILICVAGVFRPVERHHQRAGAGAPGGQRVHGRAVQGLHVVVCGYIVPSVLGPAISILFLKLMVTSGAYRYCGI